MPHIVGMYHHGAALGFVKLLPSNTPIILRAESTNAYDANAIEVFVKREYLQALDPEDFDDACGRMGVYHSDLGEQEEWKLGYIKATEAANMQLDNGDVEAFFFLDFDDKPNASLVSTE